MQLDEAFAERLWLADAESDDPVQIFEHTWVATVFRMTLRSVRESYTSRGQERLFDVLRPWLDVAEGPADPAELAQAAELSPVAARQAVHRIRERFRIAARQAIADTLQVPDEAAIEAEFASVAKILTRGNRAAARNPKLEKTPLTFTPRPMTRRGAAFPPPLPPDCRWFPTLLP